MLLEALSMGSQVVGGVINFIQAGKQRRIQRQAEMDAKKALEEAKRQININPFAALGIQKEPYELERQALLSQGAQGIMAAQEADRGAAATAGRIQMAQAEAQAGQRTAMGKELTDLAKITAEEEANIKTQLAGIQLSEAEGYQKQAQEAKQAAAALTKSGAGAIQGAVQTGIQTFVPLYSAAQARREDRRDLRRAENVMENIGMPSVTLPSQKLVASPFAQPQSFGVMQSDMNAVPQNYNPFAAFLNQ
jgi:hypothetical protein